MQKPNLSVFVLVALAGIIVVFVRAIIAFSDLSFEDMPVTHECYNVSANGDWFTIELSNFSPHARQSNWTCASDNVTLVGTASVNASGAYVGVNVESTFTTRTWLKHVRVVSNYLTSIECCLHVFK